MSNVHPDGNPFVDHKQAVEVIHAAAVAALIRECACDSERHFLETREALTLPYKEND